MGSRRTVDHKNFTYDNTLRWSFNRNEEILRAFASSIISQAVEDWIGLIRCTEKSKDQTDPDRLREYRQYLCGTASYIEIRKFFNGDWAETLCGLIDLEPGAVLRRLEKWLSDYEEDGVIPKYIHQVAEQRMEEKKCSTQKTSTAR